MYPSFLYPIAGSILLVLLSSAYLYKFYGADDRERLPERLLWYLGTAALFFSILVYGQRAGEPSRNLQVILGIFILVSLMMAARHSWCAFRNQLKRMAREEAHRSQYSRSERSRRTAL